MQAETQILLLSLLEALKAAEEADQEKQSFSELERDFVGRGSVKTDAADYEYFRRSRQRDLIAKASATQSTHP